ncbi:hypothetical protein ACKKBG_A19270 [Auxenochlorella protothecoides x Auxenochlorella symbiontica]
MTNDRRSALTALTSFQWGREFWAVDTFCLPKVCCGAAFLLHTLRLHIIYTPERTVRTEHEWQMWEALIDRVSRSLQNVDPGLNKAYLVLTCTAHVLFPSQGLCSGPEGDLPLFTVRPYSQDPAEDYCPTVLPDFLDKTYFTPFEAFVVLIIVLNHLGVLVTPEFGWEAKLHFSFILNHCRGSIDSLGVSPYHY